MDDLQADHGSGTVIFGQKRKTAMTTNEWNFAMRLRVRTARAPRHRRLNYRLSCGRDVHVEEIRITPSTLGYIAGNKAAIRDDLIRRLPGRVREQFPGRGAYLVRPIPDGPLPDFIVTVALVSEPVSDPAADFSGLVVCSFVDDLDTNLPALIEREIRGIDWARHAVDGTF